MAFNLATKWEKQFAAAFAADSYLEGRTSNKYSWDGADKIVVQSPVVVPMTDYARAGSNRFGTPTEMDNAIQEMQLTQDKGFTRTLDRGNYEDSMMAISAANWLSEEVKQVVRPTTEKYAFGQFAKFAGKIGTIAAAPAKNTVVEALSDGIQTLDDGYVESANRYLYVTAAAYNKLIQAPEFLSLEKLGTKALGMGVVGEFEGATVVKVPSDFLPANCYAILAHKEAVLFPRKISYLNTHNNPPGVNGWLIEGRSYYDAFVLQAKMAGVWALCLSGKQQAAPTVTYDSVGDTITIASASADSIIYTLDGTDPRLNGAAKTYSSTLDTSGWTAGTYTVKAVAYGGSSTPFTSNVTTQNVTIS